MLATTGRASATKKPSLSVFSILLDMAIVFAAILWVEYGYLPRQYYLPVSFLVIVAIGFVSYFILDKKMPI